MECLDTIADYALRSVGVGERLLPRSNFTLCQQFTLIGSGMIWNIYFGLLALLSGFFLATAVALGKAAHNPIIRKASEWFIFVFRGSPLFIQFFFDAFTSAWLGALIVLFLNTSAYTGEIFYGALQSIPKGDTEAADAYGLSGWTRFRRVIWPTMLRLAWPAYTNEAIFLFHSTTLVFFSGFPVWGQKGDALYYAAFFADKTFNPFIPYPILAFYFILLTLVIIGIMGKIGTRLNSHLPQDAKPKFRFRPQIIR